MQKKEKTIFNKPLNIKKKLLIQMKKKKKKQNRPFYSKLRKNYRHSFSNGYKEFNKKENNTNVYTSKLVPAPKLVKELVTFLSDDLINITLKVFIIY